MRSDPLRLANLQQTFRGLASADLYSKAVERDQENPTQ